MSEEEIQALKQRLTQVETDCQTYLGSITAIATAAAQKEAEINASNAKIIELKAAGETEKGTISTIASEATKIKSELESHNSKATELMTTLSGKQQELDGHYNGFLNKPNEGEPSKFEKMVDSYQKMIQDAETIDKSNSKIKEYETLLFGNKETGVAGLKDIIEGYEAEIKKKKEDWEGAYKALFDKIEGLLPGATSTGLSKAYQEQHNLYNRPYWIWSCVFMTVTVGMMCFALLTVHEATSVSDAFMKIISRAPFFVPAIWLAIFASKQQSQSRRLQEEYAHKETLSKSYESYKREIEKLPDSPDKLKLSENLMKAMVDMASNNPSHTLQLKHHNDKPPIFSDLFNRNQVDKNSDKPGQ